MSSPYSYGSQPSVQGWLDDQYEYMVPDKDMDKPIGKPSLSKPRDAYRDYTPELSDDTSSRGKDHRSSREKYHSSAKERYTPLSPPSEYDLDRERDKHRHASGQSHRQDRGNEVDQEERRRRHDRDTRYPPKADYGRRRRPPLTTATTSPHLTAGQPTKGEDAGKPRHRRYSQGSSSPRHLDDQASRSNHSRRHGDRSPSPPRRTSKKKDSRDRDERGHHGGSSSSPAKPRRPPLSRSQTAPHDKDPRRPGSSGRSFSFLNDPRFMTAAEAALQAGATAALASGGGKWGKDKGAKVIGAGLSAAALSALKTPAAAEQEQEHQFGGMFLPLNRTVFAFGI
ncbi:hypothetical protein VSDG_06281 [Cytospora chrysosperma]|uniref:Uncharacterized protein n=1 Tax=Cytospora chrysosperma TaxID=252740 RepID=A0A423VSA2_CYTCH|nr:hypothetical protein VSDG_06281 [Valsa sordida]